MASSDSSSDNGPITASVERLRSELDRWMDAAISGGEKALNSFGIGSKGSWRPPFDLVESTDEVVVTLDVPGVEVSDLDISLVGNMLTVKGQRGGPSIEGSDLLHVRNRPVGDFEHAIPMPTPVAPERVSADVDAGVLVIRLAKAESAKSHRIPVQSGSGTATGMPVQTGG